MKKLSARLAAVVMMTAGAGLALADDPKAPPPRTAVSYPARTSEINKHIAFVDLYLSQAITNAKALSTLGDAESGRLDDQLIAEARGNLDRDLDRALAHMRTVRTYKADLAMARPSVEPQAGSAAPRAGSGDRLAKLDQLETQLKEAKDAAKKLGGVKMEELTTTVDGVSTHLVAAEESFRDLAKWTGYTLLEKSNLATVPVRGSETGDRPAPAPAPGAPPASPSTPGTVTPGGTPPADPVRTPGPGSITPTSPSDKTKGQTIPGARPEPVKSAPGER